MSVEQQKIVSRLRGLAAEMIELGMEMQEHGGYSEMALRGLELVNGGMMVETWVKGLGEEARRGD